MSAENMPDAVKVAREAVTARHAVHPDWAHDILCGDLDDTLEVSGAILGARAMQEALAAHLAAGAEPVAELRSAAIRAVYHFADVASREESPHIRSDAYARADQAAIDAICRLASLAPPPAPAVKVKAPSVDDLAQEIRRVDGNHSLGAGALAEALMPFIRSALCEDAGADYMTATQTEMQKPENDGLFSTPAVNLHDCYRREQATKPFTPAPASDDLVERLGRIPHLFAGEAQARITSDAATIASLRAEAEKLAGRIRTQETRISSDAATISGLEAHIMHLDTEVLDELRTRAESAEAERDALKAEVARKDAALAFYADAESYREPTIDEARKRLGGADPVIAISGFAQAYPGHALAPISLDRNGNLARAALAPIPAPAGEPLTFSYRNWRGEISTRRVIPIRPWFGVTKWHPEPQWFLHANDLDKGETRDFAMRDIGPREPGAGVNGEHRKTCSAGGKVVPENPEQSENTPTLALLGEILHWAESRCPCHEEEPNPCPLCGASVENLEPCKSAENTLPRHLLKELRLAKAAAMGAKA